MKCHSVSWESVKRHTVKLDSVNCLITQELWGDVNLLSPGPLKTSATQYKNDKILNSLYVSKLDFKRFFHVS